MQKKIQVSQNTEWSKKGKAKISADFNPISSLPEMMTIKINNEKILIMYISKLA